MKRLNIHYNQPRKPFLAWVLLVFVLVSFRALALDPNRSLLQYNCQTWGRQNGLPVSSVYAIAQTKDGYLWLGTSIGLLRFDGAGFTVIGLPPVSELRNTRIACLSPAQDGGLWFGIEKSSYGFRDAKGGWFVGMNPRSDVDWDVHSLVEATNGALWLGGEFCSQIAPGTTNLQPVFAGRSPLPFATAIYQDSQGRVWLGTSGQGLYYWKNGRLNKLSDPLLDGRIIYALAVDAQGRIWVGTQSGLLCYEADFKPAILALPRNEIDCLLADRHGVLWGGTSAEGVFRFKDGNFTWLRKVNGLAGDSVMALAEDVEGSLWIGTGDGLSQLTDVKFPLLGANDILPGDSVCSVSASPRGGLWAGTSLGAAYLDSHRTWIFSTNSGLTVSYTKRVLEAKNGDVYALSGLNEVSVMSEGRVVARHTTTNMPVALVEDSKGVIVSIGGDLFRVNRDRLVPYEFRNGRRPDLYWVINLAAGRDDSFWVACVNGICRVKDGTFQQWTQKDGLGDFNARWVVEEPDGTVWVGLASGIARLRDNQIHNLRRLDGLTDPNISSIVPDEFGNLWVYTFRGLFLLNKRNVDDFFLGKLSRVECKAYTTPECYGQEQSACRTLDGRIWFPNTKGITVVDPANIPINRVVPHVHVNRVRAGGIDLDQLKPLVLKPGQRELEFAYTALSFTSPQDVRFRYRLEGLDRDWIEAGDRRLAYYANLSPGRYTFRVIACNADGLWNETGDSVQVELLPEFYQTAWFRLVCGFAAAGAVLGGYGWRLRLSTRKQRALQQARELLETKVAERTDSLLKEVQQRVKAQTELEGRKAALEKEIEERKRMEAEVERVHRQLLDASRKAGQAEVAAGVLHNVGNVLNSVNVSTTILLERLRNLRLGGIAKAAKLVQEDSSASGPVLAASEKGRRLSHYLETLAQHLDREKESLLSELKGLADNVDHIKEIVSMQQAYAKVSGVMEKVALTELVDGALKMQSDSYQRSAVAVAREYEAVDPVIVDRHRVLQILVNLLQNAKQACGECSQTDKKVVVRLRRRGEGRVAIEIADNGIGIAPENLMRIFSHGFTTRKDGHGFGLHSAALAAQEMDGALLVASAGLGRGATFTLELPMAPVGRRPSDGSQGKVKPTPAPAEGRRPPIGSKPPKSL